MLLSLEIRILLLAVWSIQSTWLGSFGLYHNPHFTLGTSHICSVEFFLIPATPLEHSVSVDLICDKFMFQPTWGSGPCVRRWHDSERRVRICSCSVSFRRTQVGPRAAKASQTGNRTSLSSAHRLLLKGQILWGNFCVTMIVSELSQANEQRILDIKPVMITQQVQVLSLHFIGRKYLNEFLIARLPITQT